MCQSVSVAAVVSGKAYRALHQDFQISYKHQNFPELEISPDIFLVKLLSQTIHDYRHLYEAAPCS